MHTTHNITFPSGFLMYMCMQMSKVVKITPHRNAILSHTHPYVIELLKEVFDLMLLLRDLYYTKP